MTVLLLAFSMNLLANEPDSVHSSFTGVRVSDEYALVSYDALRIANAKMAELEYEKEINKNLKEIIVNDSIIINQYKQYIEVEEIEHKAEVKKLKKELYVTGGCGIGCFIILILVII